MLNTSKEINYVEFFLYQILIKPQHNFAPKQSQSHTIENAFLYTMKNSATYTTRLSELLWS